MCIVVLGGGSEAAGEVGVSSLRELCWEDGETADGGVEAEFASGEVYLRRSRPHVFLYY